MHQISLNMNITEKEEKTMHHRYSNCYKFVHKALVFEVFVFFEPEMIFAHGKILLEQPGQALCEPVPTKLV